MYKGWFIDTPVVGAAVSRYRVDAIALADTETGITYAQAKNVAIKTMQMQSRDECMCEGIGPNYTS